MAMNLDQLLAFAATPESKRIVSASTKVNDTYVPQAPADLARQAGVDVNTYALARMIKSEGYDKAGPAPYTKIASNIAQGQIAASVARSRGISLLSLLTKNGLFGRQGSWVGYAATSNDPTAIDVETAKAITSDTVPDFAKNGNHFLSPWRPGGTQGVYPPGHAKAGQPKPLRDFISVITAWANEGSAWYPIPGLDSFRFMAFRKTDRATALAQLQKAKEMYARGLRGDHRPEPLKEGLSDLLSGNPLGSSTTLILLLFAGIGYFIYRRYY
jgi:hypothetical protein